MDILDIDEILKDDSFIFLEDKTHDDISNILQQWKTNNCLAPSIPVIQQELGQDNKLDIGKCTRPKRKSAQNLENQFTNTVTSARESNMTTIQCVVSNENPVVNLQIGGLVTTMNKSYLQDTSPPSFLCSMDTSVNSMSNSLITSADFTNISFLQSSNSLHLVGGGNQNQRYQHQFNISTCNGNVIGNNALNEIMRDRKTLEALTTSTDGTFIKDSHIGQIDDISLALSKTASSCSTIENSVGSDGDDDDEEKNGNSIRDDYDDDDGDANRTVVLRNNEQAFIKDITDNSNNIIDNIEHDLVQDNCQVRKTTTAEQNPLNETHDIIVHDADANGYDNQLSNKKELAQVNDSMNRNNNNDLEMNKTFDYSQINDVTPNEVTSPMDNLGKSYTSQSRKFYESTPQASNVRFSKQNYASKLNVIVDTNISPITPLLSSNISSSPQLNITYEQPQQQQKSNQYNKNGTYIFNTDNSFHEKSSPCNFVGNNNETTNIKKMRNVAENLNSETPNSSTNKLSETYSADSIGHEMHNSIDRINLKMNTDQAETECEANLLAASSNEEEFDHMLNEFGKVQLNSDQLIKMKKSLDSLKKRFNYSGTINLANTSVHSDDITNLVRKSGDISVSISKEYVITDVNETITKEERAKSHSHSPAKLLINEPIEKEANNSMDLNKNLPVSDDSNVSQNHSINSNISNRNCNGNSTSSERLLTRRSRLYDDINIKKVSPNGIMTPGVMVNKTKTCSPNETSLIINKRQELQKEEEEEMGPSFTDRLLDKNDTNTNKIDSLPSSSSIHHNKSIDKLQADRDRDRDRFKTIVISKSRTKVIPSNDNYTNYSITNDNHPNTNEFNNVPCDLKSNNIIESETTASITEPVVTISSGETENHDNTELAGKPIAEQNVDLNENTDRFKTIKINKRRFLDNTIVNVPCTNDNNDVCDHSNAVQSMDTAQHLKFDQKEVTMGQLNKNYLTYKKRKNNTNEGANPMPQLEGETRGVNSVMQNKIPSGVENTLSRPRFISGLAKLNVNKATSADELQKTCLPSKRSINYTTTTKDPSKYTQAMALTSDLKSPMGVKSKSFHNLSNNLAMSQNVTNGTGKKTQEKEVLSKINYFRKPNTTVGSCGSVLTKPTLIRDSSQSTLSTTNHSMQQKIGETVFKIPKQVSGIRAPSAGMGPIMTSSTAASGNKRAGLVRPSSGYYSLNVTNKCIQQEQQQQQISVINDGENDFNRHSSTDSMASTLSSKSSTQSLANTVGVQQSRSTVGVTSNAGNVTSKPSKMQRNLNLQQITTPATGIPKPSGLRPPTNIKQRSALPRPASYIKLDK